MRQELSQEIDRAGQVMRGRKPQLNWQKSKGQYTTTIDGQFYRLGADAEEADERFADGGVNVQRPAGQKCSAGMG